MLCEILLFTVAASCNQGLWTMKSEIMGKYYVEPVLEMMAEYDPVMNSSASVDLMLGTIAKESDFGRYNKQIEGHALGITQVEPETALWLLDKISEDKYRQLAETLRTLMVKPVSDPDNFLAELQSNWHVSIFFARLKYYFIPEPLPDDLAGQASYWAVYYNTPAGKGTVNQYLYKYRQFVSMN